MEHIEIIEPIIKKKKGRPPKVVENTGDAIPQITEPKKRGRKKKIVDVVEECVIKKKRGRRVVPRYYTDDIRKTPLDFNITNNDTNILHLDIKELESIHEITYGVLKNEYIDKKREDTVLVDLENLSSLSLVENLSGSTLIDIEENTTSILEQYIDNIDNGSNIDIKILYDEKLKSRAIQDEILIKNLQNEDGENVLNRLINSTINIKRNDVAFNKKIEEKLENKDFFEITQLSEQFDKNWIEKTDVCCWLDCHTFNTVPIGLPVEYDGTKFTVKGVYCSFGCMLGDNPNAKKSLVNLMYKKLTGNITMSEKNKNSYKESLEEKFNINKITDDEQLDHINQFIQSLIDLVDDPLISAPPKSILKMFGGQLSIEEFRNLSKESKTYKMLEYPLYLSRDYAEKLNLEHIKNINQNLFKPKQNSSTTNSTSTVKKIEEAKSRTIAATVVSTNSIDKFIISK